MSPRQQDVTVGAGDEGSIDVGATALGAALMRAQETAQPGALIHDPLAAAFIAASGRPFEDVPDLDGQLAHLETAFRADVAIRTRFFDDYATHAGSVGTRQFVLLAAGLDTRAFRLDWNEGTHIFELDLPGVLNFKDSVLQQERAKPGCFRTVVKVDLRDDWSGKLLRAGLRTDMPTAWIAEGVFAYLNPEEIVRLLDAVTALSAPGSELAFEQASTTDNSVLAQASAVTSMDQVSSMWRDHPTASLTEWLHAHRWNIVIHDRAAIARRYQREPGATTSHFVTAALTA